MKKTHAIFNTAGISQNVKCWTYLTGLLVFLLVIRYDVPSTSIYVTALKPKKLPLTPSKVSTHLIQSSLANTDVCLLSLSHSQRFMHCFLLPRQKCFPNASTFTKRTSSNEKVRYLSLPSIARRLAPKIIDPFDALSPLLARLCARRSLKLDTSMSLFDNFVRPYGFPPTYDGGDTDKSKGTVNDDEEINYQTITEVETLHVELLGALLFQKNDKLREEDKARFSEAFQRARLTEQLRHSRPKASVLTACDLESTSSTTIQNGEEESSCRQSINMNQKYEFQRSLLEERLRLQSRHQKQLGGTDTEAENGAVLKMTSAQENTDFDGECNVDCASDGSPNEICQSYTRKDNFSSGINGFNPVDENISHTMSSRADSDQKLVNTASHYPSDKLEILRQMVQIVTASNATSNSSSLPSLQSFLSTTYLPLQAREDASVQSILLAPLAHTLSSLCLLMASGVYALGSILDVLFNDHGDDDYDTLHRNLRTNAIDNSDILLSCSTGACLREAGHVLKTCWSHVFSKEKPRVSSATNRIDNQGEVSLGSSVGDIESTNQGFDMAVSIASNGGNSTKSREIVISPEMGRNVPKMEKILESVQVSLFVIFYTIKFILIRATKHSCYSNRCLNAGIGSLRYFMYALRSVKFVWTRLISYIIHWLENTNSIEESNHSQKTVLAYHISIRFYLRRIFSGIKSNFVRRLNLRQSAQIPYYSLCSEEDYREKVHSLTVDRLALERERAELREAQLQLRRDKERVLIEGLVALAWYSAVEETSAIARKDKNRLRKRKRRDNSFFRLWRGDDGGGKR